MPVFIIMNAVASLFGIGGSSLIARYLGRKDPDKAKQAVALFNWNISKKQGQAMKKQEVFSLKEICVL